MKALAATATGAGDRDLVALSHLFEGFFREIVVHQAARKPRLFFRVASGDFL